MKQNFYKLGHFIFENLYSDWA